MTGQKVTGEDPFVANKKHWDEIAGLHRVSYNASDLVTGKRWLADDVAMDSGLLKGFLPNGSVEGLDLIHLQCHIGTDTLSWARLGARVTGLDFSPESLRIARELTEQAGVEAEYIQSSINGASKALAGRTFDVVYTSIGVLGWLDDLDEWGRLIAEILRPSGVFFIREGHPMAMSLDQDSPEGELRINWPYFNGGPILDDSGVDYSSSEPVINARCYDWPHPLSDIFGSLLRAGLTIVDFQEYQSLPWKLLPWQEESEDGSYVLPKALRPLCPLAFSLVARR